MTAGLSQCEAGFSERLLCEALPQDPCGDNCRYRVCYGERASTGAGAGASLMVKKRDGLVRLDSLKVDDEVRGLGGYGRKGKWCKVKGLIQQGEGDTFSGFTSQHILF